jgi:hypothetical protein
MKEKWFGGLWKYIEINNNNDIDNPSYEVVMVTQGDDQNIL